MAEALDITSTQFLKLARQLELQPEASYPNPHYRSGPEVPLWPPELATELIDHPELLALKARSQATRAARQRKAKQRQTALAERYPCPRDALPAAAESMFNLNRYAKWERCAPAHRREIYDLKNIFVRLLYESGLAVEVRRHSVPRDGLICWGCDGGPGERCDFTGFYREPDKLVYIAFRFKIEGRLFRGISRSDW